MRTLIGLVFALSAFCAWGLLAGCQATQTPAPAVESQGPPQASPSAAKSPRQAGLTEDIHAAALDWLTWADKQVETMVPPAERAVDNIAKGGRLYVVGNTGFCEDLYERGGGFSNLQKWDRVRGSAQDVVLAGYFKPNDNGMPWNRFDEFYRYVAAREGRPVPMVVQFTSLNWRSDARQSLMPDENPWKGQLHRFNTGAPEGESLKDYALGQFATLATAWAFQGEMMAAATRTNKVLATYSHDDEPGSAQWDAGVRGQDFVLGLDVPGIPPGKIGREYLQIVARQARQFTTTQAGQVRQAAQRMAEAAKAGKMIWLVHSYRTFQSDCVLPRSLPIVYLGYDWNMDLIAPRLQSGDVLLYVGAIEYPEQAVRTALERGLECVVVSVKPGPADPRVTCIRSCWEFPDSAIALPGYPRKVLPTASVVQTLQWYSLLAETAAACGTNTP